MKQRSLKACEIPPFEEMCAEVYAHYAFATRLEKVFSLGWSWYEIAQWDALNLKGRLIQVASFTEKQVIDTIAIISPSIPWDSNVIDAESVLRAWAYFKDNDGRKAYALDCGVRTPYGWANCEKAWRVLDGLETFDLKKTCYKTWNFGQCIEKPDTYLGVCIDQHIVHILIKDGRKGSLKISSAQYKRFAKVLQHCAERIGILPSRLQAIIWCYRQYALSGMVDSE